MAPRAAFTVLINWKWNGRALATLAAFSNDIHKRRLQRSPGLHLGEQLMASVACLLSYSFLRIPIVNR